MFARALRRPCRGETWGRWRSSRAIREPAPGLEVANDERDQAGKVVGVPVAGRVGLAEAEAGRPCDPAEDVVRGDGDDDRVARAAPVHAPPGKSQLQRAVLDPAERAERGALGEAGADPAAGGKLAQHLGHRFTDPSPGTNGGLWKNGTRFSQSLAAWRWIRTVTCSGISG